jgi:hypothetical protein
MPRTPSTVARTPTRQRGELDRRPKDGMETRALLRLLSLSNRAEEGAVEMLISRDEVGD